MVVKPRRARDPGYRPCRACDPPTLKPAYLRPPRPLHTCQLGWAAPGGAREPGAPSTPARSLPGAGEGVERTPKQTTDPTRPPAGPAALPTTGHPAEASSGAAKTTKGGRVHALAKGSQTPPRGQPDPPPKGLGRADTSLGEPAPQPPPEGCPPLRHPQWGGFPYPNRGTRGGIPPQTRAGGPHAQPGRRPRGYRHPTKSGPGGADGTRPAGPPGEPAQPHH